MNNQINQIKEYFDTVLPEKTGIYPGGSSDTVYLRDGKLVVSITYSSLISNFKYPTKDEILKKVNDIMGKSWESNNIETYPKRNIIYITIIYDYNELDTRVTSKGFRSLLGLKNENI